jgi:hypothetical protein
MTKREWDLLLEYEIWPDQIICSIGKLTLFKEKFTKKLKLKILK